MYDTSEIRKGLKIEMDGDVYSVVEFLHVKPGKGGAFIRTKLKSLSRGAVVEKTFRSGEKLGKPDLEEKRMQFLYGSEDQYCFMDAETYEQTFLTEEQLGNSREFLKENITIDVLFHNNKPIAVELPTFVELAISETEPGEKGDTVSGGTKAATLETGAVIQVPL
ncbi:MAG: elongation factor P, partial [Thermodesulfobacteriota bacterium]|nr:elongation factor P [Thermodesulfobacteriota bacterium]